MGKSSPIHDLFFVRTFYHDAGGSKGRYHRMLISCPIQVGIESVGTLLSGSGDDDGRAITCPILVAEKVLSKGESAPPIKRFGESATYALLECSKGRVCMIDQLIKEVFERYIIPIRERSNDVSFSKTI